MADLIKKIKIKKQDGTFTDYIPIGADASNVNVDGESVQYKLNKKPYYYDTVADMKADTKLKAGDMVITLGYYEPNDGGRAEYKILNGDYISDNGSYHELDNNLFAKLIVKDKVNIKQFGAYGDKIHDDTISIKNSIAFCKQTQCRCLVIPMGEFIISGSLNINFSNISITGQQGNKIYWKGIGNSGNFFTIAGTVNTPIHDVEISNLFLDGTLQIFKGGHSLEEHPELTNPYPAAKGLKGVAVSYGINIRIKNNYLNDIYGEGIKIGRSSKVIISENYLVNVSGGDPVHAPSGSAYDDFGDGIVGFECFDCIFSKNTIINKRVYLDGESKYIGKPCGRSGLEFEYVLNQDNIKTPLASDLFTNLSSNYGLIMEDNFVYGYTKGIHIESTANILINKNTVIHNHIGLMNSTNGSCTITNNYFNTDGIGPAPQSGYDGYYGGIAVSQYRNLSTGNGDIIDNNIFEGDKGIILGSNYVHISNNHFRTSSYGIYDEINSDNLEIVNNHFHQNSGIYLYNSKNINFANNIFMPGGTIKCEAMTNVIFNGNTINKNINLPGTSTNISFINNTFILSELESGSETVNNVISGYSISKFNFSNNYINIKDANFQRVLDMTSQVTYATICNNHIIASSIEDRNISILRFGSQMRYNWDIENNYINNSNSKGIVFIEVNWDCEYGNFIAKNNKLADVNGYIFQQTNGGFTQRTFLEGNQGNFKFNAVPNRNLDIFKDQYFNCGETLYKYNPSDNNIGFYCYKSGIYTTTAWTENTNYSAGNRVIVGGNKVYKNITGGISTVSPSGTALWQEETTSDNLVWQYCGPLALFKTITLS